MKRIVSVLIIFVLLLSFAQADPAVTIAAASDAPDSIPLKAHFLDVGQADSILIQLPNAQTILIDGGNAADGDFIAKYIKDLSITKVDYLIGTHPHEDHIGGLAAIIKTFDIGKIYMPKLVHTSETYTNLLTTIKEKMLTIQEPVPGTSIIDMDYLKFTILAPNSDEYENINNYSIVAKLTYKSNSFLFAGDAEKLSEDEMLLRKYDLKADVFKVGHHGSTSSTSPAFALAVSPEYSIVSVGKDNTYNHPDNIIINRLKMYGEVYRTDIDGTIIIASDGQNFIIGKQLIAPAADNEAVSHTVYITETGTKYHKEGCSYLKNSKIEISLEEAKKRGLEPCSKCNN